MRCVIFIRAALPAVSSLRAGVSPHSRASTLGQLTRSSLSSVIPPHPTPTLPKMNSMKFLLSFLDDRCAGMKMIRPAGGRFMATFSSGFQSSAPTQLSF